MVQLNKRDNIKRYFDIKVPSGCEFISYKNTDENGFFKAVVKVTELEMKKVLENIQKHYSKIAKEEIKEKDEKKREEYYSRLKDEYYTILEDEFGIEKEQVIEMYGSVVSRRELIWITKTVERYIYFIKGDNQDYYICFYT